MSPSQSDSRPKWDYEGRVVEALAGADARTNVLRAAIAAELTHGGVIDRIAHETTIIGAYAGTGNLEKIREAAARLDTAREEFIDRMQKALDVSSA